jgi:hypothetical protein
MVKTLERLELQLAPLMPGVAAGDAKAVQWSGPIRRELITIRDWMAEKLLRRLRRGELVAWGRSEATGWRWVRIPTWLWDRITVLDWELGVVGRDLPSGEVANAHYEVRVRPVSEPAKDVDPQVPAASGHISTIGTETRCQSWLVDLMAHGSSPDGPRRMYYDLAQERFGSGLSVRGFARAWANARMQSGNVNWGKAGRPRKSQH